MQQSLDAIHEVFSDGVPINAPNPPFATHSLNKTSIKFRIFHSRDTTVLTQGSGALQGSKTVTSI